MDSLTKFINEVQSLELREKFYHLKDYLDLSHYTQPSKKGIHSFKYHDDLGDMMNDAFNNITGITPFELKKLELRAENIDSLFNHLMALGLEKYNSVTNLYNRSYLHSNVLNSFRCNDFNKNLDHSPRFFRDLIQVVLLKQGALHGFIAELKKLGTTPYLSVNEVLSSNGGAEITKEVVTKGTHSDFTIESFIKDELISARLPEVESKAGNKIAEWKGGGDKIGLAAFCELMFDNKWFVKGATRIQTLSSFALFRYGAEITNQLQKSKEEDRNIHKERLSKYFK